MEDTDEPWVVMTSKFKGTCRRCYKAIKEGQEIEWHSEKHTVRHKGCAKKNAYTLTGKVRRKV